MKRIDDIVNNFFEETKDECEFVDGDEVGHKWLKISRMGNFIKILIGFKQELRNGGFNYKLTLTTDDVYDELERLMKMFEAEFPASKAFMLSLKSYFKAIANGECDYKGILVASFADGHVYESLKVGDIIIDYDGTEINQTDDISAAYLKNNNGKLTLLRLVDGTFKTIVLDEFKIRKCPFL